MNCIKCGREIKDPQVFCEDCLADMERYPVKPNITVQLPVRPPAAPSKKKNCRKKYTKPEDQIRHLKFQQKCLLVALFVSLIAFVLTAAMLLYLLEEEEISYAPGQNYGSIETTGTT